MTRVFAEGVVKQAVIRKMGDEYFVKKLGKIGIIRVKMQ